MAKHNEKPELKIAQKALAKEVITFIHSSDDYEKDKKLSEVLFTENFKDLTSEDVLELFDKKDIINISPNNLIDLLIEVKAASSKREAREFITGNAIKINGEKINDLDYQITDKDFIDNTYIIIKRGKKNYYVGKKN